MNSENDKPIIIVISGTYGVGKTTLAHMLACKLNIRQRVGLGIISKTLRYIDYTNPVIAEWGNYTHCKTEQDFLKKFHAESNLVGNILKIIVEKAMYTGEPYIIDGVQLLPQYLPMDKLCYLTLVLRDVREHKDRFMNPKVTKKQHLNNANFDIIKIVEREILRSIKKYKTPIFESGINENNLADLVIKELQLVPIV